MDPYENPHLEIEARITDLLSRMSLDEKTAQMVTLYGFARVLKDELPSDAWKTAMWKDGIGNIDEHSNGNTGWINNLATPHYSLPYSLHARELNEVQRFFIEQTRLGIPADFTNEGIRGLLHAKATSFPAELAVASTWDRDLVYTIGTVTGSEGRALGYTNVYSPVADVARDPRWGRIIECYSEDPYLVSELGIAETRGIQDQHVVSTLKHFAVYSIPKGGRDGEARTDPQASWREVENIYLTPFRRIVTEAGALGVMASYNDYDGVPIEGSHFFLTELLRNTWRFHGYVVSDSNAVEFIHLKHRVASTAPEAIRQAVEAGLNIRTNFTQPDTYVEPLRKLVRDGKLSEATIDARVRDILRVKFWLGLFDSPYVENPLAADQIVRAPAHLSAADRAAHESITLLKNDSAILPLSKTIKHVLVTGPMANDPHAWWSRYGPQQLDFVTVLAGIKEKLGAKADVRYIEGCQVKDDNFPESDVLKDPPSAKVRAEIDRAAAAARDADVVVAVLGESDELCRESASRVSLNLPGYQEELLEALHESGKPIVLVLSNGRPLSINWAVKRVPAIVEMWFPGEEGGHALADVLFGDYNPSGHLPVTFPKTVGQIPMNFPAHPGSQNRDPGQVGGVLFPFGYGLSYSTFSFSNLKITPDHQETQGDVEVTCDVTNTSTRDGADVAQLYLRQDYSSVITFEKVLRGFQRVSLKAGETKSIRFRLTPKDTEIYDKNNQRTVEPGRFTVWIGDSSEDTRLEGAFHLGRQSATDEGDPIKEHHIDPR